MTIKPRIITCTDDLTAAHTDARRAKGWSHGDADHFTGLCHGFTSKLEGFDRRWGKRGFFLGYPMYCLLQALGLRLVVMPIEQAEALVRAEGDNTTRDVTLLKREGRTPVKMDRATCTMISRPALTRPNL